MGKNEYRNRSRDRQHQEKYDQRGSGVEGNLRRHRRFLPGIFGGLPGEGKFADGFFSPQQRLHGLILIGAGFCGALPHGFQIDNSAPQTPDGFGIRNMVGFQLVFQRLRMLSGGICVCRQLFQLTVLLGGVPAVMPSQLVSERGSRRLQCLRLHLRFRQLLLDALCGAELTAYFRQFGFQSGQLAAPVKAAAVQLLFQNVVSLRIRGVLLAGGDQRCDPAFKTCVLTDGKSALTDESTAFKNFPADAQQGFTAVRAGKTVHHGAGIGIYRLKLRHGSGLPPGAAGDGEVNAARPAVQTPGHGCTGPWRVTILFGNESGAIPFPAVDPVEHGGQKRTPGGFAGLIRGLKNVQAALQLYGFVPQTPKGCGHPLNEHRYTPKKHYII